MDILDKLKSQIGDDVQHIFDHEAIFKAARDEITAKLLKRERKAIRQIGGPSMIYRPPSHKGETDG